MTLSGCSAECWIAGRRGTTFWNSPNSIGLFRPDPEFLHNWPPFLRFRFHERSKCLWRLPLARENLHPKIAEPGAHRRMGQRLHDRRVELADDVSWRTLGSEKPVPTRIGKGRESHLAKGGDFRCQWQPHVACYRIGFNAPGPHQRQLERGFEKEVNLAGEQ